jgi:hypothetical protein
MNNKKLILARNIIGSNLVTYSLNEENKTIGLDNIFSEDLYQLSTENCDNLFGVLDIKNLASQEFEMEIGSGPTTNEDINSMILKAYKNGAEFGFEKANEINKDYKFSTEEMEKCFNASDDGWISFRAYMEDFKRDKLETIEVEIEMFLEGECNGNNNDGCFQDSPGHDCGCFKKVPKLDEFGCIVLIKK